MANTSDNTYAIVREAVEGTTPATPAFLTIDNNPGHTADLDYKVLTSENMKQNRAIADASKTNFSATMTLKTEFRRDTAFDLLLESGLGGKFSSNVLNAGAVDTTHSIERTMLSNGTVYRQRYVGMIVNKLQLTIDEQNYAQATYTMVGMGRTDNAAQVTGASYTAPVQGAILRGRDMGLINVGGLTATFMSLDFSVDHTRDAKFGLGSAYSFGTATSKTRVPKLTVKLYRADMSPETLFTPDNKLAVSFNIGSGVNGYSITLPACVAMVPKSDSSGSSEMVTVEFTPVIDSVSGTDIIVTKLA